MSEITLIVINGIWAVVVAIVVKKMLSVKVAEAQLRLAKAQYYREKARIEKGMFRVSSL